MATPNPGRTANCPTTGQIHVTGSGHFCSDCGRETTRPGTETTANALQSPEVSTTLHRHKSGRPVNPTQPNNFGSGGLFDSNPR